VRFSKKKVRNTPPVVTSADPHAVNLLFTIILRGEINTVSASGRYVISH